MDIVLTNQRPYTVLYTSQAGQLSVRVRPRRYPEIVRIEIKPEFRRQGHGKALVAEVQKHARRIDVACPREAQAFFEACGFKPDGPQLFTTYLKWEAT